MTGTPKEKIDELVERQRAFFRTDATLDLGFRKAQLKKLRAAIKKWEPEIYAALWKDLHKSEQEAYLTEVSLVTGEIHNHLKHLDKWARKKLKPSPLTLFPSSSFIVSEPLGNTLIVSPWNYPFQLLINPLVGCISAGCTAILKPSPYVENVSLAIEKMIKDTFDEEYIAVVQGHRDVNGYLFEHRYDLVFLTGSPDLGKIAMESQAKYLTPVVLELGGKSPCIVDKDADLATAAKRIAWGKTLNSGQTCIAPDYLFVHKDVKKAFIEEFGKAVRALHGEDPQQSGHYVRMVSDRAFDRVTGYLKDGKVVAGGRFDKEDRYIEPTLLDGVSPDAPVMQEEIFGPVFPMMEFTDRKEVIDFVRDREKPLAFYYFGNKKDGWDMVRHTTSGGACINDTIMHIANDSIPFGGVGNSGMGRYHGIESFYAFSHRRAVVCSPRKFDMPFRYMPYKFMWMMKMILK
ncbi:MAG: aldehyde dehydrogenase [Bacteroidales bacterium]|nr:aldehyde dehydrogenase [Bacteroidales bacterium]